MPEPLVVVEQVAGATEELRAAVERLLPQLSSSASAPGLDQLDEIVGAAGTSLLVARDPARGDAIVGSLTLVTYRIPTGVHAIIEDVVVDRDARGRGVGAALVNRALELAHSLGVRNVDLSSRPSREAANRLYQRLGFLKRDTNVYRHQPD